MWLADGRVAEHTPVRLSTTFSSDHCRRRLDGRYISLGPPYFASKMQNRGGDRSGRRCDRPTTARPNPQSLIEEGRCRFIASGLFLHPIGGMKRSRKLIAVRAAQLTPVITAISPHVQIIVVADNTSAALELYEQDADFVYITRLHSARHRAGLIAGAV